MVRKREKQHRKRYGAVSDIISPGYTATSDPAPPPQPPPPPPPPPIDPPDPPPPPPPPPPTGSYRDDKRAYQIYELVSTGWDYAEPAPGVHNQVQRINGSTDWAHQFGDTFGAMQFSNTLYVDGDEPSHPDGDVWIETDPEYGEIYHFGCGRHSHGPFANHLATEDNGLFWRCHASCLSYDRPLYTDRGEQSWDWYGFSTKFPSGWAGSYADWCLFTEVGYPTIQNPPLLLGLWGGSIRGEIHTGPMTGTYPYYAYQHYQSFDTNVLYSDIVDKWVDWLMGIYWSSQNVGSFIIKSRCRANDENDFITRWSISNINTWQWISGSDPVANGRMVHDVFGVYEGWQSSKTYHDGTFPRHDMDLYGWVRAPTEADAIGIFP